MITHSYRLITLCALTFLSSNALVASAENQFPHITGTVNPTAENVTILRGKKIIDNPRNMREGDEVVTPRGTKYLPTPVKRPGTNIIIDIVYFTYPQSDTEKQHTLEMIAKAKKKAAKKVKK